MGSVVGVVLTSENCPLSYFELLLGAKIQNLWVIPNLVMHEKGLRGFEKGLLVNKHVIEWSSFFICPF